MTTVFCWGRLLGEVHMPLPDRTRFLVGNLKFYGVIIGNTMVGITRREKIVEYFPGD